MLRAGGKHKRQFGPGGQPKGARIQQHGAKFLANQGAPRLPGKHYLDATGSQCFGQLAQLGALAAAVEAFDGYELSPLMSVAHARIITLSN
jgi:hypothetical protein